MQQQLSKDLTSINNLSFPEYLRVLGIEPIATRPGESDYRSPFDDGPRAIMTVYHDRNCFEDRNTGLCGTLADFVCYLFGCSPQELCTDIARHRLYLVKSKVAALP